ncbi:MAG: CPBP family intramembrane glutamic endopeptidase [Cyclobacteriaceae bacterium]|jgi:membrane protease YdiL (CAAX protease family)
MSLEKLFYSSDNRLQLLWRIIIFISLLLLAIAPLLLINNSTLQFLGATVILIISLYLNARYIDKRAFSEYGLKCTNKTFLYSVVGILIGAISVGLLLGVGYFTGTLAISKHIGTPDGQLLLLFGLKMFFVAIIEESLYRGYLFTNFYETFQSKGNSNNRFAFIAAVGVSSTLFGLAHFSTNNASVISIGFLIINGIVWCIPFIITNNLGLSIGMHFSWNFFQSFFGFTMSGNKASDSLLIIKNIGHPIWTGGDYGPEAGLLGLLGFLSMLLLSLVYLRVRSNSESVAED